MAEDHGTVESMQVRVARYDNGTFGGFFHAAEPPHPAHATYISLNQQDALAINLRPCPVCYYRG